MPFYYQSCWRESFPSRKKNNNNNNNNNNNKKKKKKKMVLSDLDRHLETVLPEWNNDKQMSFYMSSFKTSREVNTHEWDNRLEFWKRVIYESCHFKNTFIATNLELKNFMTRTSRDPNKLVRTETPLGWKTILSEMQKMNELMELNEFKSLYCSENSENFGSWMLQNMLVKPISWVFSSNNSNDQSTKEMEKTFVVMPILREKAFSVVNRVYREKISFMDLFISPSQLREIYFDSKYPQSDITLVTYYITKEGPGTVVKIPFQNTFLCGLRIYDSPDDRTSNAQIQEKNNKFQESYYGIIQLKETLFILEKQRKQLSTLIDQCLDEVHELLAKKQRNRAKLALVRKKSLEEILHKRDAYVNNLNELLNKIENATTDLEILDVLRAGSLSLNKLTQELRDSDVERAMDDIVQTIADYSEIQKVLELGYEQISSPVNAGYDEEELIKELNALKIEVTEEKQPSPAKENQVEEAPVSDSTQKVVTSTFPQPSDIPIESIKVIEYEMRQLEKREQGAQNQKLKEHLQLSLKLLKLKLKKYKKNKNMEQHIKALSTKLSELEELATKKQKEGASDDGLRIMDWISLIEDERAALEETQIEQLEDSKKKALIA
jgi:charged multivesicular body protein 7